MCEPDGPEVMLMHSSPPRSEGPLALPFQRPAEQCRTFRSDAVEEVIEQITSRMKDRDLARLFENAFPNTLDTTVSWHVDKNIPHSSSSRSSQYAMTRPANWDGVQSFVVTGICWFMMLLGLV